RQVDRDLVVRLRIGPAVVGGRREWIRNLDGRLTRSEIRIERRGGDRVRAGAELEDRVLALAFEKIRAPGVGAETNIRLHVEEPGAAGRLSTDDFGRHAADRDR